MHLGSKPKLLVKEEVLRNQLEHDQTRSDRCLLEIVLADRTSNLVHEGFMDALLAESVPTLCCMRGHKHHVAETALEEFMVGMQIDGPRFVAFVRGQVLLRMEIYVLEYDGSAGMNFFFRRYFEIGLVLPANEFFTYFAGFSFGFALSQSLALTPLLPCFGGIIIKYFKASGNLKTSNGILWILCWCNLCSNFMKLKFHFLSMLY